MVGWVLCIIDWGCWGWGKSIRAILLEAFKGRILAETAVEVGAKPFAELLNVDAVHIKLQLLLELAEILA